MPKINLDILLLTLLIIVGGLTTTIAIMMSLIYATTFNEKMVWGLCIVLFIKAYALASVYLFNYFKTQ